MSTTQQLKLIIVALLLALAGTIYYNSIKDAEVPIGDSECFDYSEFKPSTLKTGLIGDMVSIYRNKQLVSIKRESGGMDDAYAIWFDLDTIKKFIYHIEKGVEKNDTTSNKKLGIRFYYASYPEKYKWGKGQYSDLAGFLTNPKTQDYALKHTLVLLPTINVSGNDLDFNPFEKTTYTTGLPKYVKPLNNVQEPVEIDESPEAAVEVFAITSSSRENDPTPGRNHGGLYPPGNVSDLSFQ